MIEFFLIAFAVVFLIAFAGMALVPVVFLGICIWVAISTVREDRKRSVSDSAT